MEGVGRTPIRTDNHGHILGGANRPQTRDGESRTPRTGHHQATQIPTSIIDGFHLKQTGVATTNRGAETNPSSITSRQNLIRLCGLNVCGLNSKLSTGDLDDYIKDFDIFCVSESKVKVGEEINKFTTFNLENRTEDYKKPGIHGLHVYIANHLAKTCTQISDKDFYCNLN